MRIVSNTCAFTRTVCSFNTTIRAASASREKAKENCGGKQTDISKVWIDEEAMMGMMSGLGLMVFVPFNVFNKGGRNASNQKPGSVQRIIALPGGRRAN